jgi:hypothetical protein
MAVKSMADEQAYLAMAMGRGWHCNEDQGSGVGADVCRRYFSKK